MKPIWNARPRFVRSNIHCLKIFGVFLLITIILFLGLQIMKTSNSESNGDKFIYGFQRGYINFGREQDIVSELLLYLQKDELSERLKGSRWKEVIMNLKAKSCQPKNNIFFLKTHKTASSSIMNVLFRYGEFHNLTFAFPNGGAHYAFPSFFKASFVYGFSEKSKKIFNIMCHHMHFNITEVERVMPEDTFYFTILRNPVFRMESSFSYNRNDEPFKKAKNLEDFLNNTNTYYKGTKGFGYVGKNWITFDLGFQPNDSSQQSVISWHAMDNIFDLVLITEYYDESLILLKDALCWSLYDVLSFPLNSRSNSTKKTLTLDTQEKIKSWNNLDWDMYVYFNNSFWKRVQTFGVERMENEVKELRRIRTFMSEKCLEEEVDPQEMKDKSMKPYQSGSARILGYNLKGRISKEDELLCKRLVTPELQYHTILKDKQKNKLTSRTTTAKILVNATKNVNKQGRT